MRYDWLVAPDPLTALYQLHLEALGADRVQLLDDVIVFADPADQRLCAGKWTVHSLAHNGECEVAYFIPAPVAAAA